jgi:hypothetical protein
MMATAIFAALIVVPSRLQGLTTQAGPESAPIVTRAPLILSPAPTRPPAAELHSRWVSQTAVPPLAIGTTSRVTLIFRNTGGVPWERGTPAEVRLGVVGDDASFADTGMAEGWLLPTRPTRQTEAIVKPGETATFTFRVRATSPGTFVLRVRPVVESVVWLEDEGVFVTIEAVDDVYRL